MAEPRRWIFRNNNNNDFIHEGYAWVSEKTIRNRTYVHCRQKQTARCSARAIIVNGEYHPSRNNNTHTHAPNPLLQSIWIFMRVLFEATIHQLRPLAEIYHSLKILHEEAARRVTFESIRSTMSRWRTSISPPATRTYTGICEVLRSAEWNSLLHHRFGRVYCTSVPGVNDDANSLLLGDIAFLPSMRQEAPKIHISTTSAIELAVQNTRSLLTVIVEYENHAFGCMWGLIDDMNGDNMQNILRTIKNEFMVNFQPRSILTSLDWRIRTATREIWPETMEILSFHHFSLSILSLAIHCGIDLSHRQYSTIVKRFILLAILPADKMMEGFRFIIGKMNEDLANIFRCFIHRFYQDVLRGLTPEVISFNGRIESFSDATIMHTRQLRNKLGRRNNLSIWPFLRATVAITQQGWKNARTLQDSQGRVPIITTPKVRSCIGASALQRLWNLLRDGVTSIDRFLAAASFISANYFDDLLFNREYMTGDFQLVRPHENPVNEIIDFDLPVGLHPDPEGLINDMNFRELLAVPNQVRIDMERDVSPADRRQVNIENPQRNEDHDHDMDDTISIPDNDNEVQLLQYDWRCRKCLTNPIQEVALPCHCIAYCSECTTAEVAQAPAQIICQSCRNSVHEFRRVFITNNEEADEVNPYDFSCQICGDEKVTFMSTACHQVAVGARCARRIRETSIALGLALKCPMCNTPSDLEEIRIISME